MLRLLAMAGAMAILNCAHAQGLSAARLGVLYNADDPGSHAIAVFYAAKRSIPAANVLGLHLGSATALAPAAFAPLRKQAIDQLPTEVQALALIWSRPFAVGCMSITTAFAAGYRPGFCVPGCGLTELNPLFDTDGWLPADTVGWWPAMLIPTDDPGLAHAVIERGIESGGTASRESGGTASHGTLYLVRTQDAARNARAATYAESESALADRVAIVELTSPVVGDVPHAIGYFTGAARVEELSRIHFLPGAVADHLTSTGGVLSGGTQMSATAWLGQGATGSYGSVSEPCNHLEKFPNISILMGRYLRGETLLEAYWKSVAMPGQGLFVGEPLARIFRSHP